MYQIRFLKASEKGDIYFHPETEKEAEAVLRKGYAKWGERSSTDVLAEISLLMGIDVPSSMKLSVELQGYGELFSEGVARLMPGNPARLEMSFRRSGLLSQEGKIALALVEVEAQVRTKLEGLVRA
jgi:hypothetical protein